MTSPKKTALVLTVALLAGFGLDEAIRLHRQHNEIARRDASAAALRAPRPSTMATTGKPSTRSPASAAATASEVPPSPDSADLAFTPEQRVALLHQLLGEFPAQNLPELRLLAPADWLEIARKHELDSSADIRVALADLRAVARKKFAESLQAALRGYTATSAGQLPADIMALAPLLAAPADADMLARYELIRTGALGDPSEKILREKKTSDMILSVGLDGWSLNNNADLPPGFGETGDDALERVWRALATALGDDAKADMAAIGSPVALGNLIKTAVQNLMPIYGGDDAFGEALKTAVKDFETAHPGENVSNVAQVLPYLGQADKFAETLRPVFAQLAYLKDHPGQPSPDAGALQPYLDRPFNAAEALQEFKLRRDGDSVSLNFNFGFKK